MVGDSNLSICMKGNLPVINGVVTPIHGLTNGVHNLIYRKFIDLLSRVYKHEIKDPELLISVMPGVP